MLYFNYLLLLIANYFSPVEYNVPHWTASGSERRDIRKFNQLFMERKESADKMNSLMDCIEEMAEGRKKRRRRLQLIDTDNKVVSNKYDVTKN